MMGPARPLSSMPTINPIPRISLIWVVSIALRPSINLLPSSMLFLTRPISLMAFILAAPAAQARGLPPNVDVWLAFLSSNISSLPIVIPIGNPPPADLAIQMRSGSSPNLSKPNMVPSLPKPVCISSIINKAPCSRHISCAKERNSWVPKFTPPSP